MDLGIVLGALTYSIFLFCIGFIIGATWCGNAKINQKMDECSFCKKEDRQ